DVKLRYEDNFIELKVLVDAGASKSVISKRLADKRRVKARLYLAEVEAEGKRGPVFVAELNVPTPILGTYALETLGLKPNPITGKLEVVGPEGEYLLQLVGS
ncbi:hypothetical protein KEJ27_09915, partial [Candidatus Bathyarchaeota archaeon]|nr:hypothetical protein [Candidatus Bathyarchaeota archaeon]